MITKKQLLKLGFTQPPIFWQHGYYELWRGTKTVFFLGKVTYIKYFQGKLQFVNCIDPKSTEISEPLSLAGIKLVQLKEHLAAWRKHFQEREKEILGDITHVAP